MLRFKLVIIVVVCLFLVSLGEATKYQKRKNHKTHKNHKKVKTEDNNVDHYHENSQPAPSDMKALQDQIIANADKTALPANLEVSIRVSLVSANLLPNGLMRIVAVERLDWRDTRLSWNEDENAGIKDAVIPYDTIWLPDIALYNSPADVKRTHYNPIVGSNGTVIFVVPSQYEVPCQPSGENRMCMLKYGSWVYNSDQLNLVKAPYGFNSTDSLAAQTQYKVSEVTLDKMESEYFECCLFPIKTWRIEFTMVPQY